MSPTPATADEPARTESSPRRTPRNTLYLQVLIGIVLGGLIGYLQPAWGVKLKPLGDAFVSLVKMLIAPIIFSLPIQLLAYHTAVFMGTDVDQPRNLAKSVTVE